MRTQLQGPSTPQHQVQHNDSVVHDDRAEDESVAKPPGVVGRIALPPRREERHVPILGDVPVKRIQRVDEHGHQPGPVVRRPGRRVVRVALQRARNEDRERGRVLEGVGQMLASPARRLLVRRAPNAEVLDDALPEPYGAGHAHQQGHHDGPAAAPIRPLRGRPAGREKHAQRYEHVAAHLGVRRQHVGEQNVAKLAVLRLRDAPYANALQRREEPPPPAAGQVLQRDEEDGDDAGEVRHGYPVVVDYARRRPPRAQPEENHGHGEEAREDGREAVRREVVRYVVRRGAARVAYQRWDVDFGQVQVVQVEAPTPNGWAFWFSFLYNRGLVCGRGGGTDLVLR